MPLPRVTKGLIPLILLSLSGCDHDKHDHPHLATGKQLFEYHCASCHGTTGNGLFIKGIPANKNTLLSSLQIAHKITSGSKRKMPAFDDMPMEEAVKIAEYLKTLTPESDAQKQQGKN